jgi:hypothetical protein
MYIIKQAFIVEYRDVNQRVLEHKVGIGTCESLPDKVIDSSIFKRLVQLGLIEIPKKKEEVKISPKVEQKPIDVPQIKIEPLKNPKKETEEVKKKPGRPKKEVDQTKLEI